MTRQSDLAKIHIAKKQLSMDDATYRLMLRNHGGVESAKDLTPAGAAKVLAHLARCGFKPKAGVPPKPASTSIVTPAADRQALIAKITAQLLDAGRSMAYGDGMAQKMFKVEKLVWLDTEQLRKVVAALAYDAKRRVKRAAQETGHVG